MVVRSFRNVDSSHHGGWDLRWWGLRTALGRLFCGGLLRWVLSPDLNPRKECPSEDSSSAIHWGVRDFDNFKIITNHTQLWEVVCVCFFHCTKQLSLPCTFSREWLCQPTLSYCPQEKKVSPRTKIGCQADRMLISYVTLMILAFSHTKKEKFSFLSPPVYHRIKQS